MELHLKYKSPLKEHHDDFIHDFYMLLEKHKYVLDFEMSRTLKEKWNHSKDYLFKDIDEGWKEYETDETEIKISFKNQ